MEAAGDEEWPLLHHLPPELHQDGDSRYTGDGTVDVNEQPAVKASTGNWRACFFVLGVQFSECLAFFAISKNLVTYLTSVLHESNIDAARNVSTWFGTTFFTPLIGAFLADTYWGRYKTLVVFLSVYVLGMLVLTVSTTLPWMMQSSNHGEIHRITVYVGLYLTALGNGGIKPCTSTFGADQFDITDPSERVKKSSFFNWFYFLNSIGSLLSTTVIVWVQDNVGWGIGFAIPMILTSLSFTVFIASRRIYRYKSIGESPMTRASRVVVAAARNRHLELPEDCTTLHHSLSPPSEATYNVQHTTQFRFLDKAAIVSPSTQEKGAATSPWRLCALSHVEEVKMLLRLCPAWASLVVFFMITAQMSSTVIEQGMAMDNCVGSFTVPPASLASFNVVTTLVLIPIYDAVLVPLARREGEWLRAYGRLAAMVPRVEALAAGRARLEAVNALQHEFWEARDVLLQCRLLQADDSSRMWQATYMAHHTSGDDRMFAELLKSDNEDLKDFIQVLELENEELKIRMKETEGGAGHCQNAADYVHIAGDLKAELRQLKQAYEAFCSEKDNEVSTLVAEKDSVWEQFRTLERDYAILQQNVEQLRVASQKKDDEIHRLRARAKAAQAKRKLVPEGNAQETCCMPKETDGEIEKRKDRQPGTSQKLKKDMPEANTKNCSEVSALRGETKMYSSKQMLAEDGQPGTSQKRKCVTFLSNDDEQKRNDEETSNQVLEPVKKKRMSGRREVEQRNNKAELADDKSHDESNRLALLYLLTVKDSFKDKPEKYEEFLSLLCEFKGGRMNAGDLISAMKVLLGGYPELICGFKSFVC